MQQAAIDNIDSITITNRKQRGAAVIGRQLCINEAWFEGLPQTQQEYVLTHEVEHLVFHHSLKSLAIMVIFTPFMIKIVRPWIEKHIIHYLSAYKIWNNTTFRKAVEYGTAFVCGGLVIIPVVIFNWYKELQADAYAVKRLSTPQGALDYLADIKQSDIQCYQNENCLKYWTTWFFKRLSHPPVNWHIAAVVKATTPNG